MVFVTAVETLTTLTKAVLRDTTVKSFHSFQATLGHQMFLTSVIGSKHSQRKELNNDTFLSSGLQLNYILIGWFTHFALFSKIPYGWLNGIQKHGIFLSWHIWLTKVKPVCRIIPKISVYAVYLSGKEYKERTQSRVLRTVHPGQKTCILLDCFGSFCGKSIENREGGGGSPVFFPSQLHTEEWDKRGESAYVGLQRMWYPCANTTQDFILHFVSCSCSSWRTVIIIVLD